MTSFGLMKGIEKIKNNNIKHPKTPCPLCMRHSYATFFTLNQLNLIPENTKIPL